MAWNHGKFVGYAPAEPSKIPVEIQIVNGDTSVYSERTREELKKVMLVEQQKETDISIYGKTGMGKAQGIPVDAWFTGFAESAGRNIYFCVYLGRTDDKEVSSAVAKEIKYFHIFYKLLAIFMRHMLEE